jgi:hypothetical protein
MARTVAGLFDTDEAARNAVRDLEEAGIPARDISLIANNTGDHWNSVLLPRYGDTTALTTAGPGVGGIVGSGADLLAGIGMLSVPGLGPVVAAGWLTSTAPVAGGIIDLLVGADIAPELAQIYAEGIRRGGSLIAVRTNDDRIPAARVALSRNGAIDPDERDVATPAGRASMRADLR